MPEYTRAQLLEAFRTDHPQLRKVSDNQLFAAIAQDHPEAAKGISELNQPAYQSPMYPGGLTSRTPAQVASDQAAAVLRGIPQAVTSIPAAAQAAGGLIGDLQRGQWGKAAGAGAEMLHGALQPVTTSGRGMAALAFPGRVTAPSSEQWEQAAQGAGLNLGGIALGEVAPPMARAAGAAARRGMAGMAERLYESALKPAPRTNTLADIQRMVQTGLTERIPVSMSGVRQVRSLADELGQQVEQTIQSQPGATVSKYRVASRLSDPAQRFAEQVNPESDLAALAESGNEFLRSEPAAIPVSRAQALKQGTYRQLKDRAFGELKSASVESQKALARGLKEELETQFPQLQGLNLRQSDLFNLRDDLEAAVNRNRNKELIGLGTPLVGTGVGAAMGAPAGFAAAVGKGLLEMPRVKSRLAIALHRLTRP